MENYYIQLRGKYGYKHVAKVSQEDYDYCRNFNWTLQNTASKNSRPAYYVCRTINNPDKFGGHIAYLHREIYNRMVSEGLAKDAKFVDHAIKENGFALDNTRANLRPANHTQNVINRKYRPGQNIMRSRGNFYAHIKLNDNVLLLTDYYDEYSRNYYNAELAVVISRCIKFGDYFKPNSSIRNYYIIDILKTHNIYGCNNDEFLEFLPIGFGALQNLFERK